MNDNDMFPQGPDPDNTEFKYTPVDEPVIHPVLAAFLGLVGVFFLYQIIGSLVTLLVLGFDIENADINSLRLMTVAGQLIFILVPTLILSLLVYKDIPSTLRLKLPSVKETTIFIIGLIILTPLLQELLYIQNYLFDLLAQASPVFDKLKSLLDELDKAIESTYGSLLGADNMLEYMLVIIVVAVVPAICEEAFFRGYVQKSFEKKLKPFWAILITSLLFGMYHFNPSALIALTILGMYLGYAAYKSNSLLVPVILHFINNFVAVIAFFVFGNEDLTNLEVVEKMGLTDHLVALVLFSSIFILFLYLTHKNYQKLTTEGEMS